MHNAGNRWGFTPNILLTLFGWVSTFKWGVHTPSRGWTIPTYHPPTCLFITDSTFSFSFFLIYFCTRVVD